MQALESAKANVGPLDARIRHDPRHKQAVTVGKGPGPSSGLSDSEFLQAFAQQERAFHFAVVIIMLTSSLHPHGVARMQDLPIAGSLTKPPHRRENQPSASGTLRPPYRRQLTAAPTAG